MNSYDCPFCRQDAQMRIIDADNIGCQLLRCDVCSATCDAESLDRSQHMRRILDKQDVLLGELECKLSKLTGQ